MSDELCLRQTRVSAALNWHCTELRIRVTTRPFVADAVEKLADAIRFGGRPIVLLVRSRSLIGMLGGALGWGCEPCESSEVLNCRGEEELVARAGRTSKTKSIKSKLAFEVCKEHLDLLAPSA